MSVISVKNVHKKFKVFYDRGQSLKEKILFQHRNYYENRWVLNGVTFEVNQGEAIGLIGENGCGKSTLLKLMTKIMYPDQGDIVIKGRVSSLIELGAGFHPDMSGRENIYTNASIFGLTKKEIDRRLQDIIDFSELEEFIDNPVRTYSSGMYMRLAFSVAINVDADVLLIDEILAVGDANFQAKCFSKLLEIKANGVTIVIVSHSLGQIEQICEQSIWIDQGQIREIGSPSDIHPIYLEFMGKKYQAGQAAETEKRVQELEANQFEEETSNEEVVEIQASKDVLIGQPELNDKDGIQASNFKTGDNFSIKVPYTRVNCQIKNTICGFAIRKVDGTYCYGTNTLLDRVGDIKLQDTGVIWIRIEDLTLLPGEYLIDLALHTKEGFDFDRQMGVCRFSVYSSLQDVGIARQKHTWEHHDK